MIWILVLQMSAMMGSVQIEYPNEDSCHIALANIRGEPYVAYCRPKSIREMKNGV